MDLQHGEIYCPTVVVYLVSLEKFLDGISDCVVVGLIYLVSLWTPLSILRLSGAELAKVLGCLGDDICEYLHFDTA